MHAYENTSSIFVRIPEYVRPHLRMDGRGLESAHAGGLAQRRLRDGWMCSMFDE